MVIKIKKRLLTLLTVVFAAVLCAVVAAFASFADYSASAEEIADEVAVASVTFGDTTTTHPNMKSAFDKAKEYASTADKPAVITLLRDRLTNTSEELGVEANQFITLDLNGHKLHFQGVNTGISPITVSGTFTLTDRQPNTEHRFNISNNGVYEFNENGEYTLRGGVITGGYTNKDGDTSGGGCIFVNGKFIMESGTIAGNQATYNGGGVYVNNATFEMHGGTIAGNSSGAGSGNHGGGVYSTGTKASFTMNGGIIKDNVSGNNGGGVFINKGTFNLSGGTITGNTSANNSKTGGGVYVSGGTLNVSGTPVVTGNTVGGKDNNLYLGIGSIVVSGELETVNPATSAQIGLTLKSNLTFSGYYNDNNKTSELSKFFTFDNGKCTSIDATGKCTAGDAHQPESNYKLDGLGHWNECTVCHAKVNYAAHEGNAASCTEKGACTICQGEYGPNGHKFVHHAAVAPTCTAQGYKEYWHCSVCNKNYADGNEFSTNELAGGITTAIDPDNHNFDTTAWVNGGASGHYHPCLNGCAVKKDLTAHDSVGTDQTCSVCGYDGTGTHVHAFDQENTDVKYLKSVADCAHKAVYYKSCSCGEKGTETFESGELGKHNITSIVISGTPKKDYVAFDTFNMSGITVKTHCTTCGRDIDEVTEYTVDYLTGDCLYSGDESVDIIYGNMIARVDGLTVAKKQVAVNWQYTQSIDETNWGNWKNEFVYDPETEGLKAQVRAVFTPAANDTRPNIGIYRGSNVLVVVKKDGQLLSGQIKDAGVYTLALDETADEFADYEFTGNSASLTITPLTIEVNSAAETNFYWLLRDYDSALRSGYITDDYKFYSDEGNGGTYVTRSVVRYRNKRLDIMLYGARSTDNLGETDGVYDIEYGSGCYGRALGRYTAEAVLIPKSGNYVFAVNGEFSETRHMTAQLQNDGTVIITKVWYIAEIDNGLRSQNGPIEYGQEWKLLDWTYGAYVPQYAPRLEHGDPGEAGKIKQFAEDDNLVTFILYREETTASGVNKVQIGKTFNRYVFNDYINGGVPAGSYILEAHAGEYVSDVHTHWYDGSQHDGQSAGIVFHAFVREFRFRVEKAQFGQTNLNTLENQVYKYTYDGSLHLYDGTFSLKAVVKGRTNEDGIWSDAAYDAYYGKAELNYNLSRWTTGAFYSVQGLAAFSNERQKPQGADTYYIYFKLVAPNYEDLGGDKFFTVIIGKKGVEMPADKQGVYSGAANSYTVAENALYEVRGNNSYTNAGSYDITLRLKNPVNYAWLNEDGSLSSSEDAKVKMVIAKAQVSVPADRTAELNGKYVYDVGADALYETEGISEFTKAGDYEITLRLKNSVNYEWKSAQGEAIKGATVKVKLHLDAAGETQPDDGKQDGGNKTDIWLILSIITAVVIAGEVAYILYRLLRKNGGADNQTDNGADGETESNADSKAENETNNDTEGEE